MYIMLSSAFLPLLGVQIHPLVHFPESEVDEVEKSVSTCTSTRLLQAIHLRTSVFSFNPVGTSTPSCK